MGCCGGVEGLAVVERQAPAEHASQSGMSTAVLGVKSGSAVEICRVGDEGELGSITR